MYTFLIYYQILKSSSTINVTTRFYVSAIFFRLHCMTKNKFKIKEMFSRLLILINLVEDYINT